MSAKAGHTFMRSDGKAKCVIDTAGVQYTWSVGTNTVAYTITPSGAKYALARYTPTGTCWPTLPAFSLSERSLPGLLSKTSRPLYAAPPGPDYVADAGYRTAAAIAE